MSVSRSHPLLALVLSLLLPACGDRDPSSETARAGRPPDVVLITLDTTRADHLPTYGYFRDTAPAFDELAGESIVFERLIVPMATTLPTHLSILTGTHPLEHGVLANSTQGGKRFVPSPELRSFAELSRRAGYRTGGFVSAAPLKKGSGAESGFDAFDQPRGRQRDGADTTSAAIAWLAADDGRPVFLWLHLYDAHYPFEPPEALRGRYRTDARLEAFIAERRIARSSMRPLVGQREEARESINRYDEEIRHADAQMARLLDALRARDRWDRTVVVVAGDHGEGLSQHGLAAHGSTWNEQLHAPLLMRVPGQSPRRVATPISALDILPTLAGLIELPQSDSLLAQSSGRDVLAPDFERGPIFSQDTGRERSEGVPFRQTLTLDRWKYFRIVHRDGQVTEELYDLEADPFELEDVAREHPDVTRRLAEHFDAELATLAARGRELRGEAADTRDEDPQILEQLKALGYVVD